MVSVVVMFLMKAGVLSQMFGSAISDIVEAHLEIISMAVPNQLQSSCVDVI